MMPSDLITSNIEASQLLAYKCVRTIIFVYECNGRRLWQISAYDVSHICHKRRRSRLTKEIVSA